MFLLTYRDFEGEEGPITLHTSLKGAKALAQTCENEDAPQLHRKPGKLRWTTPAEGAEPYDHVAPDGDRGQYRIYAMQVQP